MTDQTQPEITGGPPDDTAIDLALSGGGFRAALFHLGVIGFLQARGLLTRVENICSVSGGSILAAYLVTHWNDFIGTSDSFQKRARLVAEWITTRDVSGEVLSRSKRRLLSFRPLDSEELVSRYRDMLGTEANRIRRWDDFDAKPELPKLHILATHLNTGRAAAYSATGFHILRVGPEQRHAQEINALAGFAETNNVRHQDIARAVAASSAFPPVFSPIPLVPNDVTHLLTDGGVYDNSGVNYLKQLYTDNEWPDDRRRIVIVSDAGREFPAELRGQYDTIMALALRVTDTQGDRIAKSDSSAAEGFFADRQVAVLRVSIHDLIRGFPGHPANHTDRVQELLAMIRTELDCFKREEAFVLYRHGYLAAQQQYAVCRKPIPGVETTPSSVAWTPVDPVAAAATKSAEEVAPARLRAAEGTQDHVNGFETLSKDELEARLADGHLVKKFSKIATSLKRRIVVAGILAVIAGGLFTLLVFAAGYVVRAFRDQSPPSAIVTVGDLAIAEAKPYSPDGWVAKIPSLTPVTTAKPAPWVYAITTTSIGSLNGKQPHAPAAVSYKLTGPLKDAEIYLFLADGSGDGSRHVVVEQSPAQKLLIPAGPASDQIRAVIVSRKEVPDFQKTFIDNLKISLEKP